MKSNPSEAATATDPASPGNHPDFSPSLRDLFPQQASLAKVEAQIREVQRLVHEETGLLLHVSEIAQIHLLALQPRVLAKAIGCGLTGCGFADADEGEDELSLARQVTEDFLSPLAMRRAAGATLELPPLPTAGHP